MVRLLQDEEGQVHASLEVMLVVLARCPRCGKRHRVLPCDVMPRKRYATDVIEHLVASYDAGLESLRAVAWGLLGAGPSHNTLHGWTQGLGLYVQGRPRGELADGLPASRALELARRLVRGVRGAWSARRPQIPWWRYRSEGRWESLMAVRRLLACTLLIGGIAAWNRLALEQLGSWPILFRSAAPCTPTEQPVAPDRSGSRIETSLERSRCEIRGRSPPGDSSS